MKIYLIDIYIFIQLNLVKYIFEIGRDLLNSKYTDRIINAFFMVEYVIINLV